MALALRKSYIWLNSKDGERFTANEGNVVSGWKITKRKYQE
jgi:hypothetical protein